MGSRIKINPKNFFECFCEVALPKNSSDEPWILQKYPETFNSEELLKPLPQFAHPCSVTLSGVQHFSFVLTNLDSKWTYGFCRQTPDLETSLCILSFLPWHETFYQILNFIAELYLRDDLTDLWSFLGSIRKLKIPAPHSQIRIEVPQKIFSCYCPDYNKLPSIPENRNLTEYFNAIDATSMITIFASMLYERRILITSKKLNRLSACIQAANSLIYPMNWQHIFIPVLPSHLLDYLSAPMPFLIGVPSPIMARVKKSELGEAVILDADENIIDTPFDDYSNMPSDIVSSLKKKLKNPHNMLGEGVSHAFLRALVHIIGGYRDALRLKPGEQITFSDEAFIRSRPQSLQPFLEKILDLQIFRQFIEERLDKLNSGDGFSDEFEFEVNKYADRNSQKLKTQYKEWVTNMKKEGGAFLKNVKSKANPAMKHAVKSVKDKGKRAYKDIRTKFQDLQVKQGTSDFHLSEGDRLPSSAPASPTRLRRIQSNFGSNVLKNGLVEYSVKKKHISMQPGTNTYIKNVFSSEEHRFLEDLVSEEEIMQESDKLNNNGVEEDIPEYKSLDMDLMVDLEDLIFRKCSVSSSNTSLNKAGVSETQSMNEMKVTSSTPFSPGRSLIQLDSVDDLEFDPLKTEVSPNTPSSGSFTMDILKELGQSSKQNVPMQNNSSIDPFSCNTQSISKSPGNPFVPSFSDQLSNDNTSTMSQKVNDSIKVEEITSKSNDPFADLVKWDETTKSNASLSMKKQWQTFQ